jgi:hypothetical protein
MRALSVDVYTMYRWIASNMKEVSNTRCDLESTKRPSMQGMSPGHISIPTPLTKHG